VSGKAFSLFACRICRRKRKTSASSHWQDSRSQERKQSSPVQGGAETNLPRPPPNEQWSRIPKNRDSWGLRRVSFPEQGRGINRRKWRGKHSVARKHCGRKLIPNNPGPATAKKPTKRDAQTRKKKQTDNTGQMGKLGNWKTPTP
jgi:hypothetical protein